VRAIAHTFHFLLRRNEGSEKRELGLWMPRHHINSRSNSSTSSSYPPSPQSIYGRKRSGFIPSLRSRRSAFVGLLDFYQIPSFFQLGTLYNTFFFLHIHWSFTDGRESGYLRFGVHLRMFTLVPGGRNGEYDGTLFIMHRRME
jgi:hypothetical protein